MMKVLPAEKTTVWEHLEEDGAKPILRCRNCGAKADYFVHGTEDWWPGTEPTYCPACGAENILKVEHYWIILEMPRGDKMRVRCSVSDLQVVKNGTSPRMRGMRLSIKMRF